MVLSLPKPSLARTNMFASSLRYSTPLVLIIVDEATCPTISGVVIGQNPIFRNSNATDSLSSVSSNTAHVAMSMSYFPKTKPIAEASPKAIFAIISFFE